MKRILISSLMSCLLAGQMVAAADTSVVLAAKSAVSPLWNAQNAKYVAGGAAIGLGLMGAGMVLNPCRSLTLNTRTVDPQVQRGVESTIARARINRHANPQAMPAGLHQAGDIMEEHQEKRRSYIRMFHRLSGIFIGSISGLISGGMLLHYYKEEVLKLATKAGLGTLGLGALCSGIGLLCVVKDYKITAGLRGIGNRQVGLIVVNNGRIIIH